MSALSGSCDVPSEVTLELVIAQRRCIPRANRRSWQQIE
jgi:hypothetical protein